MKTADEIREEFWKDLSIFESYALLERIARLRKAGVDVEKVLDEFRA
jgi:biotin operon repressor